LKTAGFSLSKSDFLLKKTPHNVDNVVKEISVCGVFANCLYMGNLLICFFNVTNGVVRQTTFCRNKRQQTNRKLARQANKKKYKEKTKT